MRNIRLVCRTHITSTLYICWPPLPGCTTVRLCRLKHLATGLRYPGVFRHRVNDQRNPIFRGFDDQFYVPHSQVYVQLVRSDIGGPFQA